MENHTFDPLKGTPYARFRKEAALAFEQGRVLPVLFSHATYQLKVIDSDSTNPFWTFIQFAEGLGAEDAFCSCEAGGPCWHIAASILRIYNRTPLPLHLRFDKSHWHELGIRLWSEIEGAAKAPEMRDGSLHFFDRDGKDILTVIPHDKSVREELEELVSSAVGTEETSIKFSNLSEEELTLWREGRPPPLLQYELSPLADLMKWCFLKEEIGMDPFSLLGFKGGFKIERKSSLEPLYRYDTEQNILREGNKEWSGLELSFLLDQKLREGSLGELHIPFEREKVPLQYSLKWEEKEALHVDTFLEHPGDIYLHGRWAYHQTRGFIPLWEPQFLETHFKIKRDEIGEFVLKNKVWLNRQPGFETHLLRSQNLLTYSITSTGDLTFQSRIPEKEEGWIDCGSWLYFENSGFFPREGPQGRNHPFDGRIVPRQEVADFIRENHELLMNIPGFFAQNNPIKRFGLQVELKEDALEIRPHILFIANFETVQSFGPYLYVEKIGFFPLVIDPRFPLEYLEPKTIQKRDFDPFFRDIYPLLFPYVIECSKELVPLKEPRIALTLFKKIAGGRLRGELMLQGPSGEINPFSLKGKRERFFLTEAGLIDRHALNLEWIHDLESEMAPWRWLKLFLLITPSVERLDIRGQKLLDRLLSLKSGKLPPLEGFLATLRPYQEEGLKWLYGLYERGFSGLLADDMGLGKTLQGIALIAALKKKKKKLRCLIVCPTSVLFHWKDKLESFLPSVQFTLYHGAKRELEGIRKRKTSILITSYGVLKRDLNKIKKIPFDLVLFDEMQMAKNHMSRLWESLAQLKGGMILGLSGTPIENRLRELKALFDLILPGYFPSENRFRQEFVLPIEREGKSDVKQLLNKLTAPFILRRTKLEVLQELPEKIEEIAHCEMTGEQMELYQTVLEEGKKPLLTELNEGKMPSPTHIFALLQKLKEVTDHPALYLKRPDLFSSLSSGKWNLYQELLEEALLSGQKVVVFTQSLLMLDFLSRDLEHKKIGYSLLKGSTVDREAAVKRFNDEDCRVFLASLKAGGLGIDLTQASVVIHYDRWWNPAKEDQATDRVHRLGQTRGVQVFKLMTLNTIEERIDQILKAKGLLRQGLFPGGILPFSRTDLLSLLQS